MNFYSISLILLSYEIHVLVVEAQGLNDIIIIIIDVVCVPILGF